MQLDRRQLLLIATIVGLRLATPRVGNAIAPGAELDDLVREIDDAGLRDIGEKYLFLHPQANDQDLLEQALGSWADDGPEVALERSIREDFKSERTVQIDEWFLSVTECRLCAIVSLAAPRQ